MNLPDGRFGSAVGYQREYVRCIVRKIVKLTTNQRSQMYHQSFVTTVFCLFYSVTLFIHC